MRSLASLTKGLGTLLALALFAYLVLQVVSWLGWMHLAYQPTTDSGGRDYSRGVLVDGFFWVLPFVFQTIVLLFASRFGDGSYGANLACALRVSSLSWLGLVVIIVGGGGVGFEIVYRIPAVLLAWSICAVAHWLLCRARMPDEGTRIVQFLAWVVLLWALVGYITTLAATS